MMYDICLKYTWTFQTSKQKKKHGFVKIIADHYLI